MISISLLYRGSVPCDFACDSLSESRMTEWNCHYQHGVVFPNGARNLLFLSVKKRVRPVTTPGIPLFNLGRRRHTREFLPSDFARLGVDRQHFFNGYGMPVRGFPHGL